MLREIKRESNFPVFMLPLHLTENKQGDFARQAGGSQSSLSNYNMRRNSSHAHFNVGLDQEFTVGEWMKQEDFTETLVLDMRTSEERKVAKEFINPSYFKPHVDVCDEKPQIIASEEVRTDAMYDDNQRPVW